jgi:hypothetical protein
MNGFSVKLQVNVLEAPNTVERFRVKAVPAVFWIRDGNVVEYKGGANALEVRICGEICRQSMDMHRAVRLIASRNIQA